MNERPLPPTLSELEASLNRLLGTTQPRAGFVQALERELRARPVAVVRARPQWLTRRQWAIAALGLAVVLALALAIVGPQRVLAQIQRWLDYVPGIGFVDLQGARVLIAPVQVSQDGVTLRVTQAVAQGGETTLLFEVDGLSPLAPDNLSAGSEPAFEPVLLLPGGQPLSLLNLSGGWGRSPTGLNGNLRFPALPAGIYQVTLKLSSLPTVRPGSVPDHWELPLTLHPATGELVAALFPQPYALAAASDTLHGVTVRVLGAVHTPDLTALRLQIQWPEAAWRVQDLGGPEIELRDDVGHVYGSPPGPPMVSVTVELPPGALPNAPTPGLSTHVVEQAYASLSPSATHLTLTVPEVSFQVPLSVEATIDLGPHPRSGDTWPMDARFDVGGVPVHLTSARLWQKADPNGGGGMRTWLEIRSDPVPDANGRYVSLLTPALDGSAFDSGQSGSEKTGADPALRLVVGERFGVGQPVPTGPVTVRFDEATIAVRGPWVIAWDIPGRQGPVPAPITRHPAAAAQTHGAVTLRLGAVTLTDRLTAIELGPVDTPAGTSYVDFLCSTPESPDRRCALEDDRGNRYPDAQVGWQTASWLSNSLVFGPVRPLARQMTLRLPAVVVSRDGSASFDLELTPEAAALPVGQAWPIDIPLVIVGQSVHFTQARLIPYRDTVGLSLISSKLDVAGDWLDGLQVASVNGPNGQRAGASQASSMTALAWVTPSHEPQEVLDFVVTDPATGAVQTGRYHVELSGARVAVRGPWVLSWNLDQP